MADSGIDVLLHFVDAWIRGLDGELHRRFHPRTDLVLNFLQQRGLRMALRQYPIRKNLEGIALRFPELFFALRAVVFAIDVTHMVAGVAICIALQKARPFAAARALDESAGNSVH